MCNTLKKLGDLVPVGLLLEMFTLVRVIAILLMVAFSILVNFYEDWVQP